MTAGGFQGVRVRAIAHRVREGEVELADINLTDASNRQAGDVGGVGGYRVSGSGGGQGAGGYFQRLSDKLAARWKLVLLAWLAIAIVGIASSAALVLDLGGAVLAAGSAVQLTLTYSGVVGGAEAGVGLFASEPWVADLPASSTSNPAATPSSVGVLLTTQLEGASAGLLLPCFDHPSYKAIFTLSVEAPDGLTALSNMPLSTSTPAATPGRTLHTFQHHFYAAYTGYALPLPKLDLVADNLMVNEGVASYVEYDCVAGITLSTPLPSDGWLLRRPDFTTMYLANYNTPAGVGPVGAVAGGNATMTTATEAYLLRLSQSNLITEAALWGEPAATAFACRLAAAALNASTTTTASTAHVDPDWLAAALAVPLGAPNGCGANGPDAGELDYDQRAGIRELGVLGKRCLARPGLIAGKYDYLGHDSHATLGKMVGIVPHVRHSPARALLRRLSFERSRILGRAQSRLQWLASYQQPVCAYLAAERAALAAAGNTTAPGGR
eukprot:XP_001697650.1 predicted protein [Chlamydomonas reinhardtii]